MDLKFLSSHQEALSPVGRELSGGYRAPQWEENFPVGSQLSAIRWEERFLVVRELLGGKRASR